MATLAAIYNLVFGAPLLRQRFLAARLKAAWFVRNEAANTANHANRVKWADALLANPELRADVEYRLFLSNTTVQNAGDATTDNDIDYVVAVFLDEWATAYVTSLAAPA